MATRKLIFILAATVMTTAGPAIAADLSMAAPTQPEMAAPPPPPPAAWSWTGIYFGGGGGYDWANFDISHTEYWNGVEDTSFDPAGDGTARAYGAQIDPNAWFGTVTAGGDFQVGRNFVLGIFGSYDIQSKDGSFDNPVTFDSQADGFDGQSWDVHLGNIATVAGRAGILPGPKVLLYGLAGYSWATASIGYFEGCLPDPPGCTNLTYTTSGSVSGPTFGAGIEWMLTHWLSTRFEYRYTDFGTFNASGGNLAGPNGGGTDSAKIVDQSVRGVIAIRLGG